jgi:cell division protein FtsQ
MYVAHVQEWRTQFQKLQSVDLRYEHQVIVNPDVVPTAGNGSNTAPEAKPAAAPSKPDSKVKKKHP